MLFQIAIDAWSGLRKSHSLPEYVPPYSKKPHSRCAIAVNARKRASKRRSKPKYVPPYPKKPGKPIQTALIHERGRTKTTTNRTHQRKTANLQYRDSQQILRDASRLCGASRQSRLHRTVQNLGRGSQLNRLVDQIAIIWRKLTFRQTVARNRHRAGGFGIAIRSGGIALLRGAIHSPNLRHVLRRGVRGRAE